MLLFESPTLFEMNRENNTLDTSMKDKLHKDRERIQFIEREIKNEWSWFKLVKPV
ncbi:MAG: hypothetical protein K6F30_06295 [Lachnospiraceae bacterium]|nr:hypothetical protein [Lachnospiraceae bacterium]MCR5546075.1 hypothetical protein [Lachnospiraceae bacterium]